MAEMLVGTLVLYPLAAAIAALALCRRHLGRLALVISTTVVLAAAGLSITSAPVTVSPAVGTLWRGIARGAVSLLLGVLVLLGWRFRSWMVVALGILQLLLLGRLESAGAQTGTSGALFVIDNLSLAVVRLVCLMGGLICLYAVPYMQTHEHHRRVVKSRQPRFFAVLFSFLGAMNGLVLANDCRLFFLFCELASLCSFLLIVHDDTVEARKNGRLALLVNCVGGFALLIAMIRLHRATGALDMQTFVATMAGGKHLLSLALFIVAAMIKSAQLPFQKWLLGAMAAPIPVSALLHAATMVNAGAYLVLRFSPALAGSKVGGVVAMLGGLCFMATAAMALGERNAKRILAYSTVGNLGLIFAAAGLGSPPVMAVGLFLLLFHAVAKGLLFLCIGTAEQRRRSCGLETMHGVVSALPVTGVIAVVGAFSMILPPFGMLSGKWLLLEAGAANIVFSLLLIVGNGCAVVYWVRFIGTLMAADGAVAPDRKTAHPLMLGPQIVLGLATLVVIGSASQLFAWCRLAGDGLWRGLALSGSLVAGKTPTMTDDEVTLFPFLPLLLSGLLLGVWAVAVVRRAARHNGARPYLAGADSDDDGGFVGPLHRIVSLRAAGRYLADLLGEQFSFWSNTFAWLFLLLLFAMVVWS